MAGPPTWIAVTPAETITTEGGTVASRTDRIPIDGGMLFRTIVMVRRGPDIVSASVPTSAVPR